MTELFAILATAAATCAEPSLAVYLAASEDPGKWPPFGPRPRFTACAQCDEADVVVANRFWRLRVAREPVLRIRGSSVSDSSIHVESDLFNPDVLYFQLHLAVDADLRKLVEPVIEKHWNDQAVVYHCGEATRYGWLTPAWKHHIPAAVFTSEADVRRLASVLGLHPKLVPYDSEKDEEKRVSNLRSMLDQFSGDPHARERISREEPEMLRFFEEHPQYWKLLTDLEKELGLR